MNTEPNLHNPSTNSLIGVLAWVLGIFTSFIGALVIFLMYNGKDTPEDKLARDTACNALNWQLTALIIACVGAVLTIILVGVFILLALQVMNIVFCIIGAVKAAQGTAWQSPMTIRFLR